MTAPVSMDLAARIRDNLETVNRRIAAAADAAGRAPDDIRLVAVSKTFGIDHVKAAVEAGLHDLGENKVQEALAKHDATPTLPIVWHLIGHLQSNKAKQAAAVFDWIHSVDSPDLMTRLDRLAGESGRAPELLIQVDLAGEATKHGAPEAEVRGIVAAAHDCRHVKLRGLMTLPPWSEDPEAARPYFRRLRELRAQLAPAAPDPTGFDQLSIGMTHDLEVAVSEGATMIRIGTALFGPRAAAGA